MSVITRFPPSPTGFLHIGRVRTALFNYLFTRQNNGKMIFRIEDTDKERSKREYEENIIECLNWLNIKYDEGPYRQSERTPIYVKYLQKMIESGYAYISKEPSEKDPSVYVDLVRFKNPNKIIEFTDIIRGDITFDTTDLKDFVIARTTEEPLYHLTVVVDDHEMGVTHVIRGEDGISNTPRQILIQEAIGAKRPVYAHIPLILAPDKSKLSGRHGAVAVTEYRQQGYLPDAILNYLALLGWNPGTEQEIFTMEELTKAFDLEKVQKAGAVFSIEKLNWFNRQYITKLTDEQFAAYASPFLPEWLGATSPHFQKLIPILRDKITILSDISTMLGPNGELAFVRTLPEYSAEELLWKKNPSKDKASEHLLKCLDVISKLSSSSFTADSIKTNIWNYAEANGKGDVLWPLRMALTGQEKSPDPFISAALLGREETLKRIQMGIEALRR